MSWDSYLDNLIAQTKDASGTVHADKACIIGVDGGAKWTTDAHANALKVNECYLTPLLSTVCLHLPLLRFCASVNIFIVEFCYKKQPVIATSRQVTLYCYNSTTFSKITLL